MDHRKSSKKLKIYLFLVLLILAGLFFVKVNKKTYFDNYFLGAKNRVLPQIFQNDDNIDTLIASEIDKFEGHWAVAVKNLKTGKTYTYNADEKFGSASLYKLAIMWTAFSAIENGQIRREELEPQLTSMISYSDNDSAAFLAEKFGWDNISALMDQEELADIDLSNPPQVTAQSISNLLGRIYADTAVSPSASKQMKELLFAQTVNDRIPKYLPDDIKVGHKTGELDYLRHDAGIVLGKKSHYIFVFLSETPIPEEASENIALLSKKIFNELENQ